MTGKKNKKQPKKVPSSPPPPQRPKRQIIPKKVSHFRIFVIMSHKRFFRFIDCGNRVECASLYVLRTLGYCLWVNVIPAYNSPSSFTMSQKQCFSVRTMMVYPGMKRSYCRRRYMRRCNRKAPLLNVVSRFHPLAKCRLPQLQDQILPIAHLEVQPQ